MAINPLSLAESLRPWRNAGVLSFLVEVFGDDAEHLSEVEAGHTVDTREDFSSAAATDDAPDSPHVKICAPAPGHMSFGAPQSFDAPSALEQMGEVSSSASRPHSQYSSPDVPVAPSFDTQSAGPQSRPAPGSPPDAQPHTRPDVPQSHGDALPEWWADLLSRTKPAPLVWTYAELGLDLSGQGSKERSAWLRRLIGSLQLPRGSSAFWPVASPAFLQAADVLGNVERGGPERFSESSFFQVGFRHLSPKVLIVLGQDAIPMTGLPVQLSLPYTQVIHQAALVLLLPGFPAVLELDRELDKSSAYLRAAIQGLSFR